MSEPYKNLVTLSVQFYLGKNTITIELLFKRYSLCNLNYPQMHSIAIILLYYLTNLTMSIYSSNDKEPYISLRIVSHWNVPRYSNFLGRIIDKMNTSKSSGVKGPRQTWQSQEFHDYTRVAGNFWDEVVSHQSRERVSQ